MRGRVLAAMKPPAVGGPTPTGWAFGFNFRATAQSIDDGLYDIFWSGAIQTPTLQTNTNGDSCTVHYERGATDVFNNTRADARLSGTHQYQHVGNASGVVWRLYMSGLPSAGNWRFSFAGGRGTGVNRKTGVGIYPTAADASNRTNLIHRAQSATTLDNNTVLDAAENLHSDTDWPTNQVEVDIVLPGTAAVFQFENMTASNGEYIAARHLRMTELTG